MWEPTPFASRAEVVARTIFAKEWESLAHTARVVANLDPRVTHGRHCRCSPCAQEDWTRITAPCGMHGESCPAVYAPIQRSTDEERAVAWLHDVIEDTVVEAVDLRDMGFPENVIFAVELLSRPYGSDYETYKRNLLAATGRPGELARKVKLADARENLWRCEQALGVPKWQRLAENRYRPMIAALEALAESGEGQPHGPPPLEAP